MREKRGLGKNVVRWWGRHAKLANYVSKAAREQELLRYEHYIQKVDPVNSLAGGCY